MFGKHACFLYADYSSIQYEDKNIHYVWCRKCHESLSQKTRNGQITGHWNLIRIKLGFYSLSRQSTMEFQDVHFQTYQLELISSLKHIGLTISNDLNGLCISTILYTTHIKN